jgi:hypothetical protein
VWTLSSYGSDRATGTGTLHEDLNVFLRAEVTGFVRNLRVGHPQPGLSCHEESQATPRSNAGVFRGIPRDDVITQPGRLQTHIDEVYLSVM